MTSLFSIRCQLRQNVKYHIFFPRVLEADFDNFIKFAVERYFSDFSLENFDSLYSEQVIDAGLPTEHVESFVDINFSSDDKRYILIAGEIEFLKAAKSSFSPSSYNTGAISITNAHKPIELISSQIDNLERELVRLFYKIS